MSSSQPWQERLGNQRDWVWRGWQIRYTYLRSPLDLSSQAATPLMLLHGFGASIGHWRHNLAVLGQQHPVYALDMLGFGASEKPLAPYNIELWVEQVYDFWCSVIQQPIILIGNSIGSLVCLAAAAKYPDMVQGLVMISLPDPSIRTETIPAALRPIIATVEGLFTAPWLLTPIFKLVRRPSIVRPWAAMAYASPAAVTEELVEILTGPAQDRGSAQAFCAILRAMVSSEFGPSIQRILPSLTIPMLLMWGQQDRMVPLALSQRFVAYNPNLRLVELENAGHCLHDECPEQVNAIILDWIQAWPSSSPSQASVALPSSA